MSATKPHPGVILSQRSMTFNELPIREESYYDQVLCERTRCSNNVTLNKVEGSPQS